jgi:hypothetical protein
MNDWLYLGNWPIFLQFFVSSLLIIALAFFIGDQIFSLGFRDEIIHIIFENIVVLF